MNFDWNEIKLYRKRFIPQENILLKDDVILFLDDHRIITKWNALKPRADIAGGLSAYFMDKGIKVSKVYNHAHEIVHWYCDIIHTEHEPFSDTYVFLDLLVDILVYESGAVKVVDLDEVGLMLANQAIEIEKASEALITANSLLTDIYTGNFSLYQNVINQMEEQI